MKILLIGEIYSSNLGDQLIYETTKYIIQKIYPSVEINELDIMGRKSENFNLKISYKKSIFSWKEKIRESLRNIGWINSILLKNSARKLIPYYTQKISSGYDLAIFTGGQIIKNTFTEYVYLISDILEHYNVNVYYNAVGLGVLEKSQIKKYKAILCRGNVQAITSRSNINRFIKTFNYEVKCIETFDTAIFTNELYPRRKTKRKENIIGLGIMWLSNSNEQTYIDFWIKIINSLNNHNITWRIFTTGNIKDYLLAQKIIKILGKKEYFNFIEPNPTKTKTLIDYINNYDAIISFRLHSHIIAFSYSIPSIAIKWDEKTYDFFKKINKLNRVYSVNDNIEKIVMHIKCILNSNEMENNTLTKAKEISFINIKTNLKKLSNI